MSAGTFKAKPTTIPLRNISLRVPRDILEKIEAAKWEKRKSVNELIVEALREVYGK